MNRMTASSGALKAWLYYVKSVLGQLSSDIVTQLYKLESFYTSQWNTKGNLSILVGMLICMNIMQNLFKQPYFWCFMGHHPDSILQQNPGPLGS